MSSCSVAASLTSVREEISKACLRSQRDSGEVTLVAVSKTWPVEHVMKAYEAGQRHFGENKLQELESKCEAMPDDCVWHFIGGIQRNKIRKILKVAHWVHSIDSLKVAKAFSRIGAEEGVQISAFLQTNFAGETTKSGFTESGIQEDIEQLGKLSNLEIKGLMAIPPAVSNSEDSRSAFREVLRVQQKLSERVGLPMTEASFGMSGDYVVAVEEGATHVRVGSQIFGSRSYV